MRLLGPFSSWHGTNERQKLNQFLSAHELQYGLRVSQRDERTGHVATLSCWFCEVFGHEEKPGRKRKASQFLKTWGYGRFKTNLYVHHHQNKHPEKWAEYQQLSLVEKQQFLKVVVPFANTMARHFARESCMQEFWFDRKLIEVIIGEVFFSLDDDNVSDSDSDSDGEGDTKAPPTSRKEQALAIF